MYKFPNGDVYEGEFIENSMQGTGIIRCSDGTRYVGHWEKGQKHGKGKWYSAAGAAEEQEWLEGEKVQ